MATSEAAYLGVDPGMANCGVAVVVDRGGKLVLVRHRVLRPKGGELWPERFRYIADQLRDIVKEYWPAGAAVEGVVWHGRRRGSLPLAQLSGAIYGFLCGLLDPAPVRVIWPGWVKSNARARKGLTTHEADAVALAEAAVDYCSHERPSSHSNGSKGSTKRSGSARTAPKNRRRA